MRVLGWIFLVLIILGALGGAFYVKTRYDGFLAEDRRSRERIADLESRVEKVTAERTELEERAASAQTDLAATRSELEELRKQRAEAEKRLAAFKELTSGFQKMIDGGKVKVLLRGGRMTVKMRAEVLFPSGSAELSPSGRQTLAEVAAIMKKQAPTGRLMVAGHTDNLPIVSDKFKSNWDLSAARGAIVTQFMVGAGMDPKKLVAAGYAEFDPVADNKTPEGLQDNRRIELVLLPPTPDDVAALDGAAALAPAGSAAPASRPAAAP